MTRVLIGLLALAGAGGVGGCANRPERPVVPLDQETTALVYDVTLAELKRIMTPKAGTTVPVNWSERMYLNPLILLPPADSANPLNHDSTWMNSILARGLVLGICGKAPAAPCPTDLPVAFTSLSPPWSLGGDTVYVQGGYTGEAPAEPMYDAVFWIFTLAFDEETGALKVVRKGPPNRMTFEGR
jgi:hypothetical protein